MKLLQRGTRGPRVEKWQQFLIGRGYVLKADGDFGPTTERISKRWQRKSGLKGDGVIGNFSLGMALSQGFALLEPQPGDGEWPPPPEFLKPYVGNAARMRRFGRFSYVHKPTTRNAERIVVSGDWRRKNIVRVRVDGVPGNKGIWLHKDVADDFSDMWAEWEKAKLLNRIVTWNGSYVARFIRGSTKTLSNHAYGSAFDCNVAFNRLGHVPAFKGKYGSVRELVKIANKHNFYWGGHFKKRRDGMHFEYAKRIVVAA